MNEAVKPTKCQEKDCTNVAYKKDYFLPTRFMWVCRKHYYLYNYGVDINAQKLEKKNCGVCNKRLDKENLSGKCIRCQDKKRLEKNSHWKSNNVGYAGLHIWVKRNNTKPIICEQCSSNKNVEFANISSEYRRDLNDYILLCASCHKAFDKDKKYVCPKCKGNHALWKCIELSQSSQKSRISDDVGDVTPTSPENDSLSKQKTDSNSGQDIISPLQRAIRDKIEKG